VTLGHGTADIFVGYPTTKRLSRPCPTTLPDYVLAHVHLSGAIISINAPFCFMCVQDFHLFYNPYDTRKALEAVVRGLRLRGR
jgi:hypothetical protein